MIGSFGLILDMAGRHLVRRRRQTLVAVSGVAIGVGFFLAVSSLMVGSQNDFTERLIDAAPHIVVSDEMRSPPPQAGELLFPKGAVALKGYKRRTEARGLRGWPGILAAAQRAEGAVASPSLSGAITLRVGGRQEPLAIIGVDPQIEKKVSAIDENLRVGKLADLETVGDGVILSEELAQRLGLNMGDVVAATAPSGKTRSLRIVGLAKRGQMFLPSSNGYVLLRTAQSLLERPFVVNRVAVHLRDPASAQAAAAALERRFGYKAESWQERSADILSQFVIRNVIMYSVVSAILLVASFGIYTIVSNSVSDKRRDIAILRAVGFSEADLQLLFVIQGLALAVAGILAGWLLGYALMDILGRIPFPMGGEIEYIPLDRSPRQYAVAAAISLLAGSVAAWLPARKASRVDPVDILRGAA
ncbi:MAG TPA: ABC transporter permease [Novosphingobium sp.]